MDNGRYPFSRKGRRRCGDTNHAGPNRAPFSNGLVAAPPLLSGRATDVSRWRKNAYIRAQAALSSAATIIRTKVSMSRLAKRIDDREIATG
jgi:hypothetical protein